MADRIALLIDDEPGFIQPLADALRSLQFKVMIARNASAAIKFLEKTRVDVITIDIMIDPGSDLMGKVDPHKAGIYLCEHISSKYRHVPAFCLSVVTEDSTIRYIQSLGIIFLRKGETPLRKVLEAIEVRLGRH